MLQSRKLFDKSLTFTLNEPFWELEGKTDFPALFHTLKEILPENSILYFEGGSPSGQLLNFLNSQSIPEQSHVAVSTIWPKPSYFHIPATTQNITTLSDLSETVAEAELAIHFHIYCNDRILLECHDAFTQPILLSGTLPVATVKVFAQRLNMKTSKWKNSGEQDTALDAAQPRL